MMNVVMARTGFVIRRLLTAAWDSVVDNLSRNPTKSMEPLPAGVANGYAFAAGNYYVEISVLVGKILTLNDVLQVLASTHDQMDEKLGWGSAVLNVYSAGVLVARGAIKHTSTYNKVT